jgi:hypothetical protein
VVKKGRELLMGKREKEGEKKEYFAAARYRNDKPFG